MWVLVRTGAACTALLLLLLLGTYLLRWGGAFSQLRAGPVAPGAPATGAGASLANRRAACPLLEATWRKGYRRGI